MIFMKRLPVKRLHGSFRGHVDLGQRDGRCLRRPIVVDMMLIGLDLRL
jgi:hypothetical protein